jgi:archaemetzincin
MTFRPPRQGEVLQAIGPLEGLPGDLRRAFLPNGDFEPIPDPGPNDWLAVHDEPGQTFLDFVKSRPNRPDAVRNTIYLQPLEDFQKSKAPPIDTLVQFAQAFFAMKVAALPPLAASSRRITTRINPYTHREQLLTPDILRLLADNLPENAFCVVAITMRDLYPGPAWNFVFGEASLRDRVGVYSFARYDPHFYGIASSDRDSLILRRSCKVLAHETCHMFGILHCIYFKCLMNGSNHLEESDRRPLHLCPVDLRKLHYSIGFDINQRYRNLLEFDKAVHFDDEAQWLSKRLSRAA